MSKEGCEAYRRYMAALREHPRGVLKGTWIDGILVYDGMDDKHYRDGSHLAMRSRDPTYPDRIRAARAKAKEIERDMLREMARKGMIPAHMAPASTEGEAA